MVLSEQLNYLVLSVCAVGALIFAVMCVCGIGFVIGSLCGYEDSTVKQDFTWGALAISYVFLAFNVYHWYVGFV